MRSICALSSRQDAAATARSDLQHKETFHSEQNKTSSVCIQETFIDIMFQINSFKSFSDLKSCRNPCQHFKGKVRKC